MINRITLSNYPTPKRRIDGCTNTTTLQLISDNLYYNYASIPTLTRRGYLFETISPALLRPYIYCLSSAGRLRIPQSNRPASAYPDTAPLSHSGATQSHCYGRPHPAADRGFHPNRSPYRSTCCDCLAASQRASPAALTNTHSPGLRGEGCLLWGCDDPG